MSKAFRLKDGGEPPSQETTLEAIRGDPRRAIQEEGIVCLICGATLRQLTNTHVQTHGTTTLEYKQRFGYNLRRALMCGALRRLYAERAIQSGLASSIGHRPIVSDPELRRRGGFRPIALEELLTRREVLLSGRQHNNAPQGGERGKAGEVRE